MDRNDILVLPFVRARIRLTLHYARIRGLYQFLSNMKFVNGVTENIYRFYYA